MKFLTKNKITNKKSKIKADDIRDYVEQENQ